MSLCRLLFAGLLVLLAVSPPTQAGAGSAVGARDGTPSWKTAQPPTPPLLKITKGSFSAYLLPESHVGSPLEFGPGFRSQVIPAARRSQTLVYEGMLLDTSPASPYWGQTCMDRNPKLVGLGSQLVSRIAAHHRHSQWADLRRSLGAGGEAFAREQFTAFLQARGLMINFWELVSRVSALLEREIALRTSPRPQLTRREYFIEYGVHAQISKRLPRLKLESIETIDDYAEAICSLGPEEHFAAVQAALEQFDAIAASTQGVQPGLRLRQVEIAFSALLMQLSMKGISGAASIPASNGVEARLTPAWVDLHLPGFSRGPTIDKMQLGIRNQQWAARIDSHAAAGRTGLMYVLGAAHLLDFESYDGLLTLLVQRGFRVEQIR
jgi:hypothetical protein